MLFSVLWKLGVNMENVIKKRYKPSESYNIYKYEITRLEALKHGYFWYKLTRDLRTKYILPKDGFVGGTSLRDFYKYYKQELKSLATKTPTDLLVNLQLALNLISIKELDLIAIRYNFQREYIYSLFFFNDYKMSISGSSDVIYFNGKSFIPKTELTKGAYIKYHPLMSKKDILKAFTIASGMTDSISTTHKLKIQNRSYDIENFNLYIRIENHIIYQVTKGVPLRNVFKKACDLVESEINDYRDYKIYQDFHKDYIKTLNIPRFSTKIAGI